jgi:hypothetical protein
MTGKRRPRRSNSPLHIVRGIKTAKLLYWDKIAPPKASAWRVQHGARGAPCKGA